MRRSLHATALADKGTLHQLTSHVGRTLAPPTRSSTQESPSTVLSTPSYSHYPYSSSKKLLPFSPQPQIRDVGSSSINRPKYSSAAAQLRRPAVLQDYRIPTSYDYSQELGESHTISPDDVIVDPSSSKATSRPPSRPKRYTLKRDPGSPAFSMRSVAESPWLQEEDDNEASFNQQDLRRSPERFDWRKRAPSRWEPRLAGGQIIKPPRPKRYMPIVEVVPPGEEFYESIQSYRARFRSLLKLEQTAHEGAIHDRLLKWSVDRLRDEGYCITDLVGFWLKATHFGRPVASFSFGPGTTLPYCRFEHGHQVRVSRGDGPMSDDAITASVVHRSNSQLRLAFDQVFDLEDSDWRVDLWSSDVAFQRMSAAIEAFNFNPNNHERNSEPGRELIIQGTHLRDVLLKSFEPTEAQDLSRVAETESVHEEEQPSAPRTSSNEAQASGSQFSSLGVSASQPGAFSENQLIQSWAERYLQPNPVAVEGDPVVGLNGSQIKAVAMMVGRRMSLIQGPPGTGKTRTIAETVRLLKVHWEVPHPLLVCTYTNVAVDNLVEALVAIGVKPLRVGYTGTNKESLTEYTLDARLAAHPLKPKIDEKKKQMENLGERIREKMSDMTLAQRSDPKSKANIRLKQMQARQQVLRKAVYAMEREALHDIINSADVVCTTCLTAASSALQAVDFPVVFLDEASMCTEPASLVPIMKGSRHIALIGDHQQLPPIITSPEAQEQGLAISLFERLTLENDVPSVMLDCQYRMHPLISAFPAEEFYAKALLDGTTDESGVSLPALNPPSSAHLIPHPDDSTETVPSVVFLNHTGTESRKDKSRVNHAEAAIVCSVIEDLLLRNPGLRGENIGIIAPYAAQISLLDRLLKSDPARLEHFKSTLGRHRALETQSIEVKTVDGFEGREKDIIIFSTVRNNASGYIGFLADRRRLNVGLTRAKRGLFVIGNVNTLKAGKIGFVEGAGLKVVGSGAGAKSVGVDVGVEAKGTSPPAKSPASAVAEGATDNEAVIEAKPPQVSKPKPKSLYLKKEAAVVWKKYIGWLKDRHMILQMLNDRVSAR